MTDRTLVDDAVPARLDDALIYDGVLTRRVFAFLIDYTIVLLLLIPFGILVALLGLLTLGLGWSLFAILGPLVAIVYVWNTLGGRVQRNFTYRQAVIAARANLRGVFMSSSVDYSWELDAGVRSDMKVSPRVGVLAAGNIRYLGVDGSLDRGNQTGYVVEGGVRFEGRAGAIELFVAGERRIDPYPVEVGTAQWLKAGFRLLSR